MMYRNVKVRIGSSERILAMVVASLVVGLMSGIAHANQTKAFYGNLLQEKQKSNAVSFSTVQHPGTSAVRSLGVQGAAQSLVPLSGSPEFLIDKAIAEYGTLFGLNNPNEELKSLGKPTRDRFNFVHQSFAQTYRGIPVFGAILRVHVTPDRRVRMLNGSLVAQLRVNTKASLSPTQANSIAIEFMESLDSTKVANQLWVGSNELMIYNGAWLRDRAGASHLAYRVVVEGGSALRESVFVSAHDGQVLDSIPLIHTENNVLVYTSDFTNNNSVENSSPDMVVRQEGGNPTYDTDIDDAFIWALRTYDFFNDNFGFASFDGENTDMVSFVDWFEDGMCPNAFWNGEVTTYCDGLSRSDIIAHEWTHGYTDFTHELIYMWESGALNEAYSDIFGETVDLISNNDRPQRVAGECYYSGLNRRFVYFMDPDYNGHESVVGPYPNLTISAPEEAAGTWMVNDLYWKNGARINTSTLHDEVGSPISIAEGSPISSAEVVDPGLATTPEGEGDSDCPEILEDVSELAESLNPDDLELHPWDGKILLMDERTCELESYLRVAELSGAEGVLVASAEEMIFRQSELDTDRLELPVVLINGGVAMGIRNAAETVTASVAAPDAPGDLPWEDTVPGFEGREKWVIGDTVGDAFRDMYDPNCALYEDDNFFAIPFPDRKLSPNFYCGDFDNGGVHINSSVANHAYALLVDGGQFNGQVITGIGFTKAVQIYWRAMRQYQTPTTNFAEHAGYLIAACDDLTDSGLPPQSFPVAHKQDEGLAVDGQITITASDCAELLKVVTATEMGIEDYACEVELMLDQDTPAICGVLDASNTTVVFSEDFETGGGADWVHSAAGANEEYNAEAKEWSLTNEDIPEGGGSGTVYFASVVYDECNIETPQNGVSSLETPEFTVSTDTSVVTKLSFEHYIWTHLLPIEYGTELLDGGNIRFSKYDEATEEWGPWVLVRDDSIEFNSYNNAIFDYFGMVYYGASKPNDNPLRAQPAFGGPRFDTGSIWGTTHINLTSLGAAKVKLRFDLGTNGYIACAERGGWYLDNIQVVACASECGDGEVTAGEECDDGNSSDDSNGCSDSCQFNAVCGNGLVEEYGEIPEVCEVGDGNCDPVNCTLMECGNGVVNQGEQCDDGNLDDDDNGCNEACQFNGVCGNGQIEFGEQCDDGNDIDDTNGCSGECLFNAVCGDGIVQAMVEQCDDGNQEDDGNGCSSSCTRLGYCGDGVIQSEFEVCDDGDNALHEGNLCGGGCEFGISPPTVGDPLLLWEKGTEDTDYLIENAHLFGYQERVLVEFAEVAENGSVRIEPNEGIWFTPAPDWFGDARIEYRLKRDTGEGNPAPISNTGSIIVTIEPVNDPPILMDETATVEEEGSVVIDLLSNATDVETPLELTLEAVNPPANGSVEVDWDLGSVTYTPNDNFVGVDTFEYSVRDPEGATSLAMVTVEVTGTNDSPQASEQVLYLNEDTTVLITPQGGDIDGDELTWVASEPANGTLSWVGSKLLYRPNLNFFGTDTFTVTASDGGAESNVATIILYVIAQNDAPKVSPQTVSTNEDSAVDFECSASDVEDDALTWSVTAPGHGVLTGDGPNYTYTPNAKFSGTDVFWVTVNDGELDSMPAKVVIVVVPAPPEVVEPEKSKSDGGCSSTNSGDGFGFLILLGMGQLCLLRRRRENHVV